MLRGRRGAGTSPTLAKAPPSMLTLGPMPFGMRWAPWADPIEEPDSLLQRLTLKKQSLERAIGLQLHRGAVRAMWQLKLNKAVATRSPECPECCYLIWWYADSVWVDGGRRTVARRPMSADLNHL